MADVTALLRLLLVPYYVIQVVLSVVTQVVILYGGFYHYDHVIPVPKSHEMADKLTYTIRICVFPCAVILFHTIISTANKRGTSKAINPLSGNENLVQIEKNILTNTLEQSMMFLMISLVLMTYLEHNELHLIPLYALVWIIGRVGFIIGYGYFGPSYRSYGMLTNIISTVFFLHLIGYLMYKRGIMSGIDNTSPIDSPNTIHRGSEL